LQAKALAVVELCGSTPNAAPQDATALSDQIRMMLAERARRSRRPAATVAAKPRRTKNMPS
jgi:hypothetical protein